MIEKHIVLEDIDPVVFYGVGNAHLQMIKALYPKLRIVARDNVIRVIGDEEQMAVFEEQVETMRKHVLKYNRISEEDILDITKGQRTKEDAVKGVVVYNISGRPIKSRSENQQRLIDAFDTSDMTEHSAGGKSTERKTGKEDNTFKTCRRGGRETGIPPR